MLIKLHKPGTFVKPNVPAPIYLNSDSIIRMEEFESPQRDGSLTYIFVRDQQAVGVLETMEEIVAKINGGEPFPEPPSEQFSLDRAAGRFNDMYDLRCPPYPSLPPRFELLADLKSFKDILLEEIDEVDDIMEAIGNGIHSYTENEVLDILTDLADWLHDVQIYCATRAKSYGIPIEASLAIIMESNFSKLDENGNPIYDERGKVMKGPNYWKPEPQLREMIKQHRAVGSQF
jgi:hypothetical protein